MLLKAAIVTANIGSLKSVAKLSNILHVTNVFETTVNVGVIVIDSVARCGNITRFAMRAGLVLQKTV